MTVPLEVTLQAVREELAVERRALEQKERAGGEHRVTDTVWHWRSLRLARILVAELACEERRLLTEIAQAEDGA